MSLQSVAVLAFSAYEVLLKKLRWLRERYRKDNRAGEFWAVARQRVCGTVWLKSEVQSQVHWFGGESSTIVPMHLEFKLSRFKEEAPAIESFEPQVLAIETSKLSTAIEVA